MPLFFLAPKTSYIQYQYRIRHIKAQKQDESITHMSGKLPNTQEPTRRQLCLVANGKKRERARLAIWGWTKSTTDHSRIDKFRERFLARQQRKLNLNNGYLRRTPK